MGRSPDAGARESTQHLYHGATRVSRRSGNQPSSKERVMAQSTAAQQRHIKVGVIVDETGPLSFAGIANANVARMVVGDLNAKGGLLGRPLELCLEDSE